MEIGEFGVGGGVHVEKVEHRPVFFLSASTYSWVTLPFQIGSLFSMMALILTATVGSVDWMCS